MVGRIAVLILLGFALLLVACGNSGADAPPTATAATVPSSQPEGPQATIFPRSGPPGTEVTINGSGWQPGIEVQLLGQQSPTDRLPPYEVVTTDANGSFSIRFRVETRPDGSELETGSLQIIAQSADKRIDLPFLVETRHPVTNPGPGG